MFSPVVVETINTFSNDSCHALLNSRSILDTPTPICSHSTMNAVTESMEFMKAASSLFSSKYSFLAHAIQNMNGHDTFGVGKGLSVLLFCAAPVGLATIGTVTGDGATLVTGLVHGAVRTDQLLGSIAGLSDDQLIRQKFTDAFIERMRTFLLDNTIRQDTKAELIAHPEMLIGMGVVSVAFNSRELPDQQLNTAFGIIDERTIEDFPRIYKTYFDYVCSVKDDIRKLSLSVVSDSNHWDLFKRLYVDVYAKNLHSYDQKIILTMVHLVNMTEAVCELFLNDPYFKDAWQRANEVKYY